MSAVWFGAAAVNTFEVAVGVLLERFEVWCAGALWADLEWSHVFDIAEMGR